MQLILSTGFLILPPFYSGFENLMAVYGYGLQIYCDFSGYTDIAIGLALILGFRLPVNFNSPYKAASITDFWKRWHISLSRWLKGLSLYITGRQQEGKDQNIYKSMITMLLGGLMAWSFTQIYNMGRTSWYRTCY